MDKKRPPEYAENSNSNKEIYYLSRLTYLMVRRYLRTPPNNYPRFFYKYLPCDMDEGRIRSILIESDLYLNSCKNFNDPFDTTANIINTGSLKDLRKRYGEIVETNQPHLKKHEKEVVISMMMKNYADDPNTYKKILTKNTQAAGIFSITKNSRNILMWSHYASQHKGFLLQFELARDPASFLYALEMDYSENYPKYDISLSFEHAFKEVMLRKSEDWRYENEWRLLRIGGADSFHPFKQEALTGLIFGCKSDEGFRNKILSILEEREKTSKSLVKVYKAEMHPSKYKLNYFKLAF